MSTAAVSASELQTGTGKPRSRGEFRFDAVSRALYSTDASVYQIEPLGVVAPANARRSRGGSFRSARACSCPITMRGGGTSQAGQAIGAGLIVDTSKYLNGILELNVAGTMGARRAGRRARRAERAASPARPSFRARRLDRQPRHARRDDGEQLQRRPVRDLRKDDRPRYRAGGRPVGRFRRHVRTTGRGGACAEVRRRHARGPLLSNRRRTGSDTPDEIERRFPKVLRRVGGYNLDDFVPGPSVQPRADDGRIGRHPRRGARSEGQSGSAARGQGGDGDPVRASARVACRGSGDPRASSVGDRGDGQVDPRSHAQERCARSHAAKLHRGRSRARCSASSSTTIEPRTSAAAPGARTGPSRAQPWLSLSPRA